MFITYPCHLFTTPADTKLRKKTISLGTPLKRKEEFSLFKVSDDEYKVKISPQLLLATQRFLSRGEGKGWSLPLVSAPRGSRSHPGQTPAWLLVSRKLSESPASLCRASWCLLVRRVLGTSSGPCCMPCLALLCGLPQPRDRGRAQAAAGGRCDDRPFGPQWTLSLSPTVGQRWMCSARCESPRKSCCTC